MIDCIDCGAPVERLPGEKDIGERCAACWNRLVCGDDAEHFEMYGDDPYYDNHDEPGDERYSL